uniref:Chemokine interleukin-8-like domain-containing protein n=1 Tax=Sinocyclocheilus rhinocerous TaxID=307959 RepID=A0A673K2E3_9TELE
IQDQNKMKTAFIVLVCLLVVEVKGELAIEKVEIILSSPSCKRLEIVVSLKREALQKCLNPGSKLTKKYILKVIQKKASMQIYVSLIFY